MTGAKAIRSSDAFLETIREAARREVTPEERREQVLSYVYGFMNHDADITRDQLKEILEKQYDSIRANR